MADTPEVKVKKKIKEVLNAHEVYFVMPIGTGYGNSGVPDFLCCVEGKFVAIEAKAGNNRPTALQEKHLWEIEEKGGVAMVINEQNLMAFDGYIRLLKDKK